MNARIKERIEQINSGIVPEGYQKTAFGIFPCDWLKVSLGEVSSKKGEYGLNAPACEYAEGLPKYLRITDIDEQGCYIDNNAYVNDTDSNKYILGKGDIVFARTGASVGKNYIYNEKDGILVYAGFLIKFSIKPQYNAYLICLNCRTKKYDNWVAKMCARSGQPGINAEEYATYSCIIPKSTQEQARIAEILMQWDKAIELQGKLREAYQKLKKYCLNKMFPKKGSTVPEIRFPGFTAPWEQRKLGEISEKTIEKNRERKYSETFTNSAEFGIVSQMEYFDHAISKIESIGGYYVVHPNDFVYNPRISVSAPVGPINRNKLQKIGVMSPLYTVFRAHTIHPQYLEFYFKSDVWHAYMRFNGDSGARSDRFSIKTVLFFDMPIPCPQLEEQEKIGKLLEIVDNLITLHQKKREKLVAQRKILQQYLLTGIVRV